MLKYKANSLTDKLNKGLISSSLRLLFFVTIYPMMTLTFSKGDINFPTLHGVILYIIVPGSILVLSRLKFVRRNPLKYLGSRRYASLIGSIVRILYLVLYLTY